MSWQRLLAERKVQLHTTSKQELDVLRALIERDLTDAALTALSADRRFATAYNAALQTAKIVISCAGYRVASTPGHHRLHFEAARIALGLKAKRFLDYFDACRRKRNVIDYDAAFVATETEAEEILREAKAFLAFVEQWISSENPYLAKT
jgi:uncharacterized protein (UPF0332 family)